MKHSFIKRIALLALLIATPSAHADGKPLPIVLVHGLMADSQQMQGMLDYLKKYLPGVYIKNASIGFGKFTSLWNMHSQAAWLRSELQSDPHLRDGFTVIAHSQGGLVARYFLQHYNSPRVVTYISLGCPHMGIFGTPSTIDSRYFFLDYLETKASYFLYSPTFQKFVSFAGYWRDTTHYDDYLNKCNFLPYLNNEKEHEHAARYKENIMSLKNMVLIKAEMDDFIEPAESCHFGFYRIGYHEENLEPLTAAPLYIQDKLGLRVLNESKRLHLRFARCTHEELQSDERNFLDNILPFLQ